MNNGKRKSPLFAAILLLALILSGCAAGYRYTTINGVETVSYVDEEGNKRVIYTIDKDGKATIYDENDPKAKMLVAQQNAEIRAKEAQLERYKKAKKAKKRANTDPIVVSLPPTSLSHELDKVEKNKGGLYSQLRKEFEDDKVIRIHEISDEDAMKLFLKTKMGKAQGLNKPVGADVEVITKAYVEEQYGISSATKKPAKMVALIYEAHITSPYFDETYDVKESGNLFRNVEITKKFSTKIKKLIKTEIGARIPAERF